MAVPAGFEEGKLYDVIVVGGGPAGLTAALYLARARCRVLVVEKAAFGGQITITDEVVNYPGVPRASGAELTETMRRQAESFGAEFLSAEAEGLDMSGEVRTVRTSRGDRYAFGVLLATGAHPRTVGFRGEEEYKGRGVAYCATCDGQFFTGRDVFVIGGGFAAAEEAVFLTRFARHVTVLIRRDDFSCAGSVAEHARSHPKITVLTNTAVEEVSGGTGLNYIRCQNTATGEVTEFRAAEGDFFGVFVFAGYEPATALVRGLAELDGRGYVITDRGQKTSVDGLYAAGDLCVKPLRQVVTAVGDGALAATELEKYAAAMREKTGLRPTVPEGERVSAPEQPPAAAEGTSGNLFPPEIRAQLDTVLDRMERPLILKLYLDGRPVSAELEEYVYALCKLSGKLRADVTDRAAPPELAPCVKVCREDGSETGLAFHGVPGGHEFTSFILGLYNAAGPGQDLDADTAADIAAIDRPVDLKVLVSLSCTMCPELAAAAQRIAAASEWVTAEVYDVGCFPDLKERYNVMSVPCLVINGERVSFGRKNIRQVLELLK